MRDGKINGKGSSKHECAGKEERHFLSIKPWALCQQLRALLKCPSAHILLRPRRGPLCSQLCYLCVCFLTSLILRLVLPSSIALMGIQPQAAANSTLIWRGFQPAGLPCWSSTWGKPVALGLWLVSVKNLQNNEDVVEQQRDAAVWFSY